VEDELFAAGITMEAAGLWGGVKVRGDTTKAEMSEKKAVVGRALEQEPEKILCPWHLCS
jgi:hypothetical protein